MPKDENILRTLPIAEVVRLLEKANEEDTSIYCKEIIYRFEPLLRKVWSKRVFYIEYEDFMQDAFLALFESLPQLNNAEAFPGFFHAIVQRVAIRYWTKRHEQMTSSIEDLHDVISYVDDKLLLEVFVRSYLEHLAERDKEILRRRFLQGESSEEIAGALNLTPSKVRVYQSRALKKLRDLFKKDFFHSGK